MNKKKRGFGLIEVAVGVAILSTLATVIAPKVKTKLNESKVAKVSSHLDTSRSLVKAQYSSDGDAPDIAALNKIPTTMGFSDSNGKHPSTNKIVTVRDNTGGWIYDKVSGQLYANLPDGAYTHDPKHEIWGGEVLSANQPKRLAHNIFKVDGNVKSTTIPRPATPPTYTPTPSNNNNNNNNNGGPSGNNAPNPNPKNTLTGQGNPPINPVVTPPQPSHTKVVAGGTATTIGTSMPQGQAGTLVTATATTTGTITGTQGQTVVTGQQLPPKPTPAQQNPPQIWPKSEEMLGTYFKGGSYILGAGGSVYGTPGHYLVDSRPNLGWLPNFLPQNSGFSNPRLTGKWYRYIDGHFIDSSIMPITPNGLATASNPNYIIPVPSKDSKNLIIAFKFVDDNGKVGYIFGSQALHHN